ncbi:class I SAM-dependent methyltransferase [Janthinobacterium sp. RB2R34]|uniref:class I SAM-dependent methyltransferase n=1 Tax=Janthinobacterium sp. RB2R34 TaxID=3424193 RepID=UPI003F2812B9
MATNIENLKKISWRDPSGFVAKKDGRIFRAVSAKKAEDVEILIKSSWYLKGVADGWFPASEWVAGPSDSAIDSAEFRWLEHRALDFPCYPHEITALQLYDAAKMTLQVAMSALENGWIIKDASAWNILFEHGKPRFCDLLSFERIDDSGVWIAYAQFFRHFVIPLLLYRHTGMQTSAMFVQHRDGLQPEQVRRVIHGWRAYVQPALEAVTLPMFFGGMRQVRAAAVREKPKSRPAELAKFLLQRTLKRLERHINALKPAASAIPTKWENYETDRDHYDTTDVVAKADFVRTVLERPEISTVLDLGCNAGEFSKIAAEVGNTVVAADYDHGALSRLYQQLRGTVLPISPILLDIGRPTPPVGWMNQEVDSFLVRAAGKFDCIMALGLVHHLLVSERAGLPMILDFFHSLRPRFLILEWIEPQDLRFAEIAGINKELYSTMSIESFERLFSVKYSIEKKQSLVAGNRTLYLLEKKG